MGATASIERHPSTRIPAQPDTLPPQASPANPPPSTDHPLRIRTLTSLDLDTAAALQSILLNLKTSGTADATNVIHSTFCLAPEFASLPTSLLPIDLSIQSFLQTFLPPLANPLIPLRTDGDGNCLLHAASLSMFGSHDRAGVLRELTTALLSSSELAPLLEDAWKQDEIERAAQLQQTYGIELQRRRSSLQREYDQTLSAGASNHAFVGSFHVLSLAHVLRRPIIIYGTEFILDADGNPLSPNELRGIYLPIGLPPHHCSKIPLALCFSSRAGGMSGHFTALTAVVGDTYLPLFDGNSTNLAVRYCSGDWLRGATEEILRDLYLTHRFDGDDSESRLQYAYYNDADVFLLEESIQLQQQLCAINSESSV